MKNLEIPINKYRIGFIILLFSLALILGIITIYYMYQINYISIKLVIILSFFLLLFPYILYLNLKIITSNKPGLILNKKGIHDHISVSKLGLIEWTNIKSVQITRVSFSDIILLDVHDRLLIEKNLSKRLKNLANKNVEKYGTPCAINISNLKYDKDEIMEIISQQIQMHQS
jgi:hypothetical protein